MKEIVHLKIIKHQRIEKKIVKEKHYENFDLFAIYNFHP